jgi:hypothetical protein
MIAIILFLVSCGDIERNYTCDGYCKGIGYPLGGYAGAFEYVQEDCGSLYERRCELKVPDDCTCMIPASSLIELTPENPLDANAAH